MKSQDTSSIACVFSPDRKEVLLVKRRDVPVWVLPGGGIEINESPESAAVRELKEETGFEGAIKKKVGEYSPINRLTRLTHLFECSISSGEPKINDECSEIRFFPLSELPPMPLPYKDWISDALSDPPEIIKKKLKQVTYLKLFENLILHPLLVCRFLLSRLGIKINN